LIKYQRTIHLLIDGGIATCNPSLLVVMIAQATGMDEEVIEMGIAIEELEDVIMHLPQGKLKKFRAWFAEFDAKVWDEQIEKDALSGKLDALASAAIASHTDGKSIRL